MSWRDHVLPHGPLVQLAPRLWQVAGTLRRQSLPRAMVVYQRPGGGRWVHRAIALDEATQAELEALGSPEVLVVPNGWHRLDCAVYKERYPELRVTCPAAARKAVERVVAVDEEAETGAVGGGVSCLEPAGTRPMERAWRLELDEGHALIFCDLLFNLDHLPGFGGWMARYVTASTGFFGVTRLGRFMGISDKAAFRGWLEDQADEDGLRIISVAHGEVLTEDCAVRLREAAGRL